MVQEEFKPSLETRPFGTPLRKFNATLKAYTSEKREPSEGSGGKAYMVINFDFTDLIVIESVEPYQFPIATISVSYSTSQQTKWDALAGSIKNILGLGATLDDIVGRPQTWAFTPATLRVREADGNWVNAEQECWQVAEMSGASAGGTPVDDGIDDHVLAMLDGKDEQSFYQVFYQDELVRKHPDLITAATERTLLATLMTAGRVTRDAEGIYHRTEGAGAAEAPSPIQPVR